MVAAEYATPFPAYRPCVRFQSPHRHGHLPLACERGSRPDHLRHPRHSGDDGPRRTLNEMVHQSGAHRGRKYRLWAFRLPHLHHFIDFGHRRPGGVEILAAWVNTN